MQRLLGAVRKRGVPTFDQAVENSRILFDAAASAGIGRIVHFSVANASSESRLPYFRGKGQVEEILKHSGIPYAIIRPTLVFGDGDLLLNNMAWACGGSRSSPYSGEVITPSSPSTPRTWRVKRWRLALRMKTPSPTLPGRIHSPLRSCCGCWLQRWAHASGWWARRRPRAWP